MSQRSLRNQIEESDYENKWSQWAKDVEWMSNHRKEKISPRKKRIEANHNITPLLCPGQ